jgi:hypothetical protein
MRVIEAEERGGDDMRNAKDGWRGTRRGEHQTTIKIGGTGDTH